MNQLLIFGNQVNLISRLNSNWNQGWFQNAPETPYSIDSLLFYPLFNFEWCAGFITKEGFRSMLVTLRGFVPKRLALVHFLKGLPASWRKRENFWSAGHLFKRRTRSWNIKFNEVVVLKVYGWLLAAKLESFASIRL